MNAGLKTSNHIVYLSSFALYVFWATSGYGSVGNYLALGFCIVVMLLNLVQFNRSLKYSLHVCEDRSVVYFILFFIFHCLTSIVNLSDVTYWLGNVIAYTFVSLFPVLLQRQFATLKNRRLLVKLLYVTGCVWLIMVLISIGYYIMNPDIARDAIVYQDQYDNLFIGGGYFLAYGSCIVAVFLFGLYNKKVFVTKKQKRLVIASVAILAIHVFLTKSTLTTIWLTMGLVLDIVFAQRTKAGKGKWNRRLVVFVILFGLLLMYIFFGQAIGGLLMEHCDYGSDSLYERRLYELGTVLNGSVYTRHTLERLSKPVMSWGQFAASPLIGIGYKYGYTYSEMKLAGLGTHSELVDTLAKYGIIGFLPWIAMLISMIRSVQLRLGKNATSVWIIILACLMFFNPFVSMPSMVALGLLIPLVSMVITK